MPKESVGLQLICIQSIVIYDLLLWGLPNFLTVKISDAQSGYLAEDGIWKARPISDSEVDATDGFARPRQVEHSTSIRPGKRALTFLDGAYSPVFEKRGPTRAAYWVLRFRVQAKWPFT
jgi:hypothetical protein